MPKRKVFVDRIYPEENVAVVMDEGSVKTRDTKLSRLPKGAKEGQTVDENDEEEDFVGKMKAGKSKPRK